MSITHVEGRETAIQGLPFFEILPVTPDQEFDGHYTRIELPKVETQHDELSLGNFAKIEITPCRIVISGDNHVMQGIELLKNVKEILATANLATEVILGYQKDEDLKRTSIVVITNNFAMASKIL